MIVRDNYQVDKIGNTWSSIYSRSIAQLNQFNSASECGAPELTYRINLTIVLTLENVMIFEMNATKELFVKYLAAQEAETAAIKAFNLFIEQGGKDMLVAAALSKHMEETHNTAMDIWDQLQEHRLDV